MTIDDETEMDRQAWADAFVAIRAALREEPRAAIHRDAHVAALLAEGRALVDAACPETADDAAPFEHVEQCALALARAQDAHAWQSGRGRLRAKSRRVFDAFEAFFHRRLGHAVARGELPRRRPGPAARALRALELLAVLRERGVGVPKHLHVGVGVLAYEVLSAATYRRARDRAYAALHDAIEVARSHERRDMAISGVYRIADVEPLALCA